MHSRLLFSSLSSVLLLAAACGDDRGDTSATEAATTGTPTTGTPTTGEDPTTGTTGTPTTSTTEEPTTSPPTTDPGSTTGSGACQVAPDANDEDGDGVANMADNCPCDQNPNQLDYDGNAVGNVCDEPLRFQVIDGTPPEFNKLDTTASAGMGPVSCEFPVALIAIGGDVQVELDDAGQGKVFVSSVSFADAKNLECNLFVVNVKLDISKLVTMGDMPFVVGFPFTVQDHDAGTLSGMMDAQHSINVNGTINITESSNPDLAMPGEAPLENVPGNFPAGMVTVSNAGQNMQIMFDDGGSTVLEQMTMTGITIKLTGLKGTLKMAM